MKKFIIGLLTCVVIYGSSASAAWYDFMTPDTVDKAKAVQVEFRGEGTEREVRVVKIMSTKDAIYWWKHGKEDEAPKGIYAQLPYKWQSLPKYITQADKGFIMKFQSATDWTPLSQLF